VVSAADPLRPLISVYILISPLIKVTICVARFVILTAAIMNCAMWHHVVQKTVTTVSQQLVTSAEVSIKISTLLLAG
jgi:hypothetical protein